MTLHTIIFHIVLYCIILPFYKSSQHIPMKTVMDLLSHEDCEEPQMAHQARASHHEVTGITILFISVYIYICTISINIYIYMYVQYMYIARQQNPARQLPCFAWAMKSLRCKCD